MISLIVARDRNGAIGKGNEIPWHAPEDLKFFMRETMGGAVIMGRNTWDSLPFKPLKNRLNIVVSTQGVDHEHVFPTVDDAVAFAKSQGRARIYGIGGFGIYKAMLPLADRLLITQVDVEVDDPDTYFPKFDEDNWRVLSELPLRTEPPACIVIEWLAD